MHLIKKLFKVLKNGIELLVGQAVFYVIDQNRQNVGFGSITQEPLGLLNFDAIFEFLGQFSIRCIYAYAYYFFKKDVDNF